MEYDILGTQEITKQLLEETTVYLSDYKSYGGYRFGSGFIGNHLIVIKDYNENNNIFTKEKVLEFKTIHLPFLPSSINDFKEIFKNGLSIPRIATLVISEIDKVGEICIINTHLDNKVIYAKKKQLTVLKQIIEQYINRYPVVLMGDFNMNLNFQPFSTFTKELSNLGLKRVEINKSTQKHSKHAIDHIFIPSNWEIVESGIVLEQDESIKDITDHTGIFVKTIIPSKKKRSLR